MILYALYDDSGEIRYIGQTSKTLEKRMAGHLWPSSLKKPGHKNNWLNSMLAQGQKPQGRVLQEFYNQEDLDGAERYWIKLLRDQGCRLVNDVDGGEGLHNPSPETRARMSAAKKGKPSWNKGKPVSEETREKLRQANLGKKASAETKAKMSQSHAGKPCVNPEALRASRLGWKATPEQRENMRRAARLRAAQQRSQSSTEKEI